MSDLNLFEDFTHLKWVKWTTRKPHWNGTIYMRFNGKNTSIGKVSAGHLMQLEGLSPSEWDNYEDTFYWLEETIDIKAYESWCEFKTKQYEQDNTQRSRQ